MRDSTFKACIAMLSIVLLEVYALSQGINGVVLTAVIGALAGLGGYTIGSARSSRT